MNKKSKLPTNPRVKNLIGERHERLEVIEYAYTKNNKTYWLCKCDCGNTKVIQRSHFTSGLYPSCGCLKLEKLHKKRFKDLTGQRFGRLEALSCLRKQNDKGHYLTYWLCKCDCGEFKEVYTSSLTSGNTNSCGCLNLDNIRRRNDVDLTGQRFGRLIVLESSGYKEQKNGTRLKEWLCKCDCGNTTTSDTATLRCGKKKSCKKCLKGNLTSNWKGGLSKTSRYFRKFCSNWIKDTLIKDNYTCQITKLRGGDLVVHHLVSFKDILNEAIANTNLYYYESISQYTEEELNLIQQEIERLHYKYGLGITLKHEVHRLFHETYGFNDTTEAQFMEFKNRYKNGEFDFKMIMEKDCP